MAEPCKKHTIAIIVGPFPSTSETFILNHITSLIDLGHNVDVFAFGRSKEEQIVHEKIMKYSLDKNVTYLFPIPYDRDIRWNIAFKVILFNIFRHPVRIYRCFKMKQFGKLSSVDLLILAGFFMKKRYDVIHSHFGPNAQKMCFLKDILNPVKFVVTFHGYDIRKGLAEEKGYYRTLFDKADNVIAICDYNKAKLQELGCPLSKIAEIPNIIDTELFNGRQKKNSGTFVIATVARFVPEKNYEFAINIIKAIKDSYTGSFQYFIIGDGALKQDVEAKVKEFGLERIVVFKGALKQSAVKEVLDQTDLFLLSSRNEILPTVVLEAQSMGIPVVATDIGGLRQTMIDGKTGFLVPLDDVETAKNRILQLMKDPALREDFSRAGKIFIEENFDKTKISQKLIHLYEN